MSASLADVLAAWQRSPGAHEPLPGASADDLAQAEDALGRPLPAALAELYLTAGGGSFLHGNLGLHPLLPDGDDDLALTTAGDLLRSWDWPIPDQLLVFGDNGAGDVFGLWLAETSATTGPVVQVGEVFEDECLAVIGDTLPAFLAGWTAYYLLLDGGDHESALDALGVPPPLRSLPDDGSDEEFYARLSWASPGLPDPQPDPYERGLSAAQVDALVKGG